MGFIEKRPKHMLPKKTMCTGDKYKIARLDSHEKI
jgi:hypothetical protein